MSPSSKNVDRQSIENSILMLKQYVGSDEVASLVSVLEQLVDDPDNQDLVGQLSEVYTDLGVMQGAVLTYAPCISVILGDKPYDNREE